MLHGCTAPGLSLQTLHYIEVTTTDFLFLLLKIFHQILNEFETARIMLDCKKHLSSRHVWAAFVIIFHGEKFMSLS